MPEQPPVSEITDRDFLIALFNLVGALAERLTGLTPMVCVHDQAGNVTHFYPSTQYVTWIRREEVARANAAPPIEGDMRCPLHTSTGDRRSTSSPTLPSPASNHAFQPGQRVVLASGGPPMTVVDIGAVTGQVWCRWPMPDGSFAEQSFPAALLRHDGRTLNCQL